MFLTDPVRTKIVTANYYLNSLPTHCNRDKLGRDGLVLEGGLAGGGPDGEDEGNLVDEIGDVVEDVQHSGGDTAHEVTEEVAQGVDGPAKGDNELHGVVGSGNSGGITLTELLLEVVGFTGIDLVQDVEPSGHATDESNKGGEGSGLTSISEGKHDDGADQQTPEHTNRGAGGQGGLGGGVEDEVEFNHLQRDGDVPVNVTVDHRGGMDLDPELTHVEVVNTGDEGNQSTAMDGGLVVVADTGGFHQQEHGGGDHGNGDDPERDTDGITLVQEAGGGDAVAQPQHTK